MPKVSIVVPVYNVEKYLPECLNSLANQSFQDFEVVLIDDGSTDSSGALLDQFAASHANFRVTHQANAGVSATRQRAISLTTGQYLAFVDSDDFVSPAFLETAVRAAEENRADIVCFQYEVVWDDAPPQQKESRAQAPEKIYRGASACFGALFTRETPFFLWNKLYRRELFEGIELPPFKIYEDSYILPSIFARAQCLAILQDKLYFYRMRAQSLTHLRDQAWLDCWIEATNQTVRLAREKFPEHLKKAEARVNIIRLRCMDSILECPRFRKHPCWKTYSRRMRKWLPEILRADKSQVRFMRKLYALTILFCPDLAAAIVRKKWRKNQAFLTSER